MAEDFDATPEKEEKSISSDLIRGHINTIILRSLADGDKYGYEIIAEIEEKSHGQYSLKQPSLYSALKRLETQNYVTSYWGGSVGGGRRKYFSLTPEGQAVTEQNRSEWEYSRTIIDSLISDKDFDFNNPAPTAVDMRVLKNSTSRVPAREGDGSDEIDYEPGFGEADRGRIEELERRNRELEEEKAAREREIEELREREEELRKELLDEKSKSEEEKTAQEQELEELRRREEQLRSENEEQARKISEQEQELLDEKSRLDEEKIRTETYEQTTLIEERYGEQIKENEKQFEEERTRYEDLIRERDELLEEERLRHEQELQEQKERILSEQETLFRQREQELLHQNYINLVNSPPAQEEETEEFDHFTPPVAEETMAEQEEEPPHRDYRTIIQGIYAGSVQQGESKPIGNENVRSLGGIDFQDIEARAARDGIRIYTSAGVPKKTKEEVSSSVVHKGKALFISALIVFFVIVAEGAIVLGLHRKYGISVALPYVMWGLGLVLLLSTGLAFANHFGERALRKSSPALINTIVGYALAVIVTLIIALSVNIDFHSVSAVASFVVIPIIFLFGIVIFGVSYWLQVRPKQ